MNMQVVYASHVYSHADSRDNGRASSYQNCSNTSSNEAGYKLNMMATIKNNSAIPPMQGTSVAFSSTGQSEPEIALVTKIYKR